MRIARVTTDQGTFLAQVVDDTVVPIVAEVDRPGADPLRWALADGVVLADADPVADTVPLASCRLLAPVRSPEKILGIGLNYADHARESGMEPPASPVMFPKTANSLVGPDDVIRFSQSQSTEVDYEVELAVVIGRRAVSVDVADALDYVLGYTVCNDVSARDAQFADVQWSRGKSFDTFCPLGPWIVTADEIPDPQALEIRCRVNGVVLQDSSTSQMIFGVAELVGYLSRFITLEPGDVIATGTPFGVGFARKPPIYLWDGDEVECEIAGIGTLRNPVREV